MNEEPTRRDGPGAILKAVSCLCLCLLCAYEIVIGCLSMSPDLWQFLAWSVCVAVFVVSASVGLKNLRRCVRQVQGERRQG